MNDDQIGIAWIHGLFGAETDWDVCADHVQRALDLPQARLALPGHGNAARLRKGITSGFDAAATALWRQLPAERRWLLVGYSMGARLALAMARLRPARCAGLVLVSGHPGLARLDRAARESRLALDQERAAALRLRGPEAFLREWYAAPLFAPWIAQVGIDAAVAARGHVDAEGAARCLERLSLGRQRAHAAAALLQTLDASTPAGSAPAQILAVAGDNDRAYDATLRRWVAAANQPDDRIAFASIQGSGHAVHLEQPAALAELVIGQKKSRPGCP